MSKPVSFWVGLCGLLALMVPVAQAPPVGGLRARRESVYEQTREVRRKKLDAIGEAGRIRGQLRACQERLRAAESSIRMAQSNIRRTQEEIRAAAQAAQEAEEAVRLQQDLLRVRVVAIYKSDPVTYLEVVLDATDFTDMLAQSYLCEKLMENDRRLIEEFGRKRQEAETQKALFQNRREALNIEEGRLQTAKVQRAADAEQQKVLLRKQNAIVAEWERKEEELEAESASITAMLQAMTNPGYSGYRYSGVWRGPWTRPCGGSITSGFGYRIHPIAGYRKMHTGVDMACPTGSPVVAAGTGMVISTGSRGGYGNCIIIDHGGGKSTLYGHLSAILVPAGQTVSRGQAIGRVGSTGYSTGPHLHWEVRINGVPVNPL